MEKKIYSVFDIKGKVYTRPFFMNYHGEALREFGDAVQDEKTRFHAHPEDYQLFYLGEFDDVSGIFTSLPHPENLGSALNFIEKKPA